MKELQRCSSYESPLDGSTGRETEAGHFNSALPAQGRLWQRVLSRYANICCSMFLSHCLYLYALAGQNKPKTPNPTTYILYVYNIKALRYFSKASEKKETLRHLQTVHWREL